MAYQTATNPDTGERLILVNDAWQKIEKSATNKAGEKAYLVQGSWLTPEAKPEAPTTAPVSEGMPQERSIGQAIMQAPTDVGMGLYKGFKNVSDTLIKGGASAVDYLAGTNTRATIDESARRANEEYQQKYGSRVLAKSGEILGEVGSTLLPIAGVAKVVAKGAELAPSLAKFLTPVAESIASGGFRTGLPQTAKEAAAAGLTAVPRAADIGARALGGATGGAIGAGLVNPEDAGLGAVVGAAIPAVAVPAAKGIVNWGRSMFDPGTTALNQAVGDKGGQIINALRSPNAVIVPGSSPTAGQVAAPVGSTGFSGLTKDLSELPKVSQLYADKTAQTNVARIEQQARVDARLQGVVNRVTDKIDNELVTVTPSEVGSGLHAIGEKAKKDFKNNVLTPGYNAAFDLAGNGKIDISNVVTKAEDILGQKLSTFAPETAPTTVRKLLSFQPKTPEAKPLGGGLVSSKVKTAAETPAGPPTATLKDLDDVRKAINADIQSAITGNRPTDPTTLRNLMQLHKEIDDAIGKSTAIPDTAKTAYADVVQTYRTEYVPRFKEGANANLFKQTSLNELKTKPEDVINKYFNPGGESEAKQFVTLFGDSPDALKIAGKGIEDLYRQKVVDAATGLVKPEAHAKFLKDYAQPIRIMDDAGMGLGQRFATIGKDVQRLQRLEGIQAGAANKLAPGLPAGENALAVEKRISELTQGLNPRQLSAVNAVRDDLARAAEYERLAQAGRTGNVGKIATETGKSGGMPFPSLLNTSVTAFNFAIKRLLGKMDEKTAIALATELANPASAAKAIERAMVKKASQEINTQYARNALRPITMGGINALAGQE
jgi:hypothetical protein